VAFGAQVVAQAFAQDGIVLQQQQAHALDCGATGFRPASGLQGLQSLPMLPLTPAASRRRPTARRDRPAAPPCPVLRLSVEACCCWPAPGSRCCQPHVRAGGAARAATGPTPAAWGFGAALVLGVLALHLLLLAPLANRWTSSRCWRC
jgi:hypothetical protein